VTTLPLDAVDSKQRTQDWRRISETNPRHGSLFMEWNHISDHDLERHYLGMVRDETELAALEEHLLACASCAERADEAQDYVDAMRVAALEVFDP